MRSFSIWFYHNMCFHFPICCSNGSMSRWLWNSNQWKSMPRSYPGISSVLLPDQCATNVLSVMSKHQFKHSRYFTKWQLWLITPSFSSNTLIRNREIDHWSWSIYVILGFIENVLGHGVKSFPTVQAVLYCSLASYVLLPFKFSCHDEFCQSPFLILLRCPQLHVQSQNNRTEKYYFWEITPNNEI